MKKIFLFLLILASACKTTKHNNDFRGIKWGASKDEVIKAEGREPDNIEGEFLVYATTLNKVPMMLGYRFAGDRLATATYIPQNAGNMPKEINEAYVSISDSLNKVYGASNDSLMDNGTKVRKTWQTPSTEIHIIYYMQSFMLEYSSKMFRPMLVNEPQPAIEEEEEQQGEE